MTVHCNCKYSKTSPPKVHTSWIALHWRLADTRKYWKILLPAASSDGNLWCCPPHSLIAFLLPPDIQTNTLEFYSLKTLTGVCFPKDNFLVDLGCSINNHQTSTPPVDQALVTQKLCIHYFEPTPPTAPGQPGWPGYLTHYLALVESGPKHFSLAHCGIRWTLALNASGH